MGVLDDEYRAFTAILAFAYCVPRRVRVPCWVAAGSCGRADGGADRWLLGVRVALDALGNGIRNDTNTNDKEVKHDGKACSS